jgi:PhnB protein
MQIAPYLNFDGQCRAAFEFYEQCLGGKIEQLMTHADSPMAAQTPPAWRDRIMHVRLVVGDYVLMGSDAPPEYYQRPQGLYVSLTVGEPAEAERIFQALAENGAVQMPLQETFWSARFGMLVDRFGTPWMINCQPAA